MREGISQVCEEMRESFEFKPMSRLLVERGMAARSAAPVPRCRLRLKASA